MSMRAGPKIVSALLLMAAILFLFTDSAAADSGENTVSYTFSSGAYEIGKTDHGHEITMEGYGRIPTPGYPMMPSKIFHVAVPPGAEITGVTIEAGRGIPLDGEYSMAPVALPRVANVEDPDVYAMEKANYDANHASVYNSGLAFPVANGEFVGTAGYRKYNLAEVRISPFSWNPRSGELVLHSEITAHVHYTVPERLPQGTVLVDNLVRTEKIARGLVVNYDQAQAWYPPSSAGRGLHDYVIITLPSLTTAVQTLVNWETAKGRTVEVVTTDWINTNYTGWDLAAKMRVFLREKYPSAEWGIEDVCLVGHYDGVPMRRCEQDVGYGKPETDFYFAELSKADSASWDADGDHLYGENSDPIDFYGEVNVGRLPWSDVTNVQNMCQKSADFEASADLSFKKNILLLGAYFWPDTDNAVLMEYKTNPAINPWMTDWTSTKLYEVGHSSYPCDANLTYNNTRDMWSAGKYAFVNWAGHGNPTGSYIYYSSGPFVDTGTCNALNDDYPAIIFADACSNSDTDYTNLGQCMLRKGGVGFLGATKVAYGSPGWSNPNHGSGQSLDYYFTTYVTSGDYTQGAAHQIALTKMYTDGLFYYMKYEIFEWGALWGQPNLSMYVEPPLIMAFPDGVPGGMQNPGLANTVTLEIADGQENYVAGSGKLYYRFDPGDSYTEVTVTSLGGDLYEATIPNTTPGCQPEFYFSASGDGGTTLYSPYNAPAEIYSFDVCFVELLLEDNCEASTDWTVENTSITTGAWEHADPQGTSDGGTQVQPENDHSAPGTMCWVTESQAGGSYYAYDLDGGPTRLLSPVYDLSNGDAYISFWLWFYHSSSGTVEPCDVHVTNNNGMTWVKAMSISHKNSWTQYSFRVSDFVIPNDKVQVRITADDNPNDSVVEAAFDDLKIELLNADPSLWADAYSIPVSTGAVIDFSLDAGAGNAGRQYLVLGSMSGTSPGYTLPTGTVLPLNWDVFTDLVMILLNTPVCQQFMGNLNGSGMATATLNTGGALNSALVGVTAHFAFLLGGPIDYASNAIPITFDL